jgi:hypothetical protein
LRRVKGPQSKTRSSSTVNSAKPGKLTTDLKSQKGRLARPDWFSAEVGDAHQHGCGNQHKEEERKADPSQPTVTRSETG